MFSNVIIGNNVFSKFTDLFAINVYYCTFNLNSSLPNRTSPGRSPVLTEYAQFLKTVIYLNNSFSLIYHAQFIFEEL